jgi:hypothetical protein
MYKLRADTSVKVPLGPFVATDGTFMVTNATLATATATQNNGVIIKHDDSTVQTVATKIFTALTNADGMYHMTFLATDVDTEGHLTFLGRGGGGYLPVRNDFMVVNANVFDSLYAADGTDLLDVNVATMGADVLDSTALATTAVQEIAEAILPPSNTALADVTIVMIATDHTTGATEQTLAISRSIDGGAFSTSTATSNEIDAGFYSVDLPAADVNGKTIMIRATATGADETMLTIITAG